MYSVKFFEDGLSDSCSYYLIASEIVSTCMNLSTSCQINSSTQTMTFSTNAV